MKWKIPLSDIDIGKDEIGEVTKVLRSKWLSMGPVTEKFEDEFAKHFQVKHAIAVSNGTAALHLALVSLGIGENDEVICPSLTFVATANSIICAGATPVFADITSLSDINISPESIKTRITTKTKAITVVHYGGYPCDMDAIMAIAEKEGLKVIEDAAHAPGAEYNGRKLGTIGDVGCFSFFSNKNMVTGEGGMVVTNDDLIAERIKRIRSHGMTALTWHRHKGHASRYDVLEVGYNYRIDEMRSALGIVQLKKLNGYNEKRRKIVKKYIELLEGIPGVFIPFRNHQGKSSYHLFPIMVADPLHRGCLINHLKESGIQSSIHYPPIHKFLAFRKRFPGVELPKTEFVGDCELTLPLYPGLHGTDLVYIVERIRESINRIS
ncbi:MAG: DegT/DnrJ/EryC1/StrS family aminotransferase [Candidatus Hodarchaeota archaeon]